MNIEDALLKVFLGTIAFFGLLFVADIVLRYLENLLNSVFIVRSIKILEENEKEPIAVDSRNVECNPSEYSTNKYETLEHCCFQEDIKKEQIINNNIKKKISQYCEWIESNLIPEKALPLEQVEIEEFKINQYLNAKKDYEKIRDIEAEDTDFLKNKLVIFYNLYKEINRISWQVKKTLEEIKNIEYEFDKIDINFFTHKGSKILFFRKMGSDQDFVLSMQKLYYDFKNDKNLNIGFLHQKLFTFRVLLGVNRDLLKKYSGQCKHGVYGAFFFPNECEKCKKEYNSFLYKQKVLFDYENKLANLTPEEIGKRYERYIGYLYETNGYKVEYNGIKMGKKDDGIDIIATKRRELIIIQCKWYKEDSQIHSNTIRQLNDNLHERTADNPNKNVVARLYSAYDNLDEQARARLAKTQIEHIVLPYDNEYPKIKCNINDDSGEKIYHLPGAGMYDYIKINVNRGEFYAKTIEEAEKLGFRGVKKELKAIHGAQQTQAAKEQNEPSEDDAEMEALINGGV
ncbi:MAG: restriction endonuclease [Campylobacter sp.]|uniref:restriction endonuclease n=1 Tax=Campylobacter sp. TaxID=205 RepID=UPI003F9F1C2F